MLNNFKSLDIYPKTLDDFRVRTLTGGAISIIAIIVVFVLVVSEFMLYTSVERMDELYVDTSHTQTIPIYLNITFPAISCDALNLDLMDVSGDYQLNIAHTVYKQRLSLSGAPLEEHKEEKDAINIDSTQTEKIEKAKKLADPNYCGPCYGAEITPGQCCRNCDEVREAYRKKGWAFTPTDDIEQCYAEILERKVKYAKQEGCNLHGHFSVNKVAGNFHFTPGKTFQRAHTHIHDYTPFELEHFNTTHVIHSLGFGEYYPGITNPLDDTVKVVAEGSALYQYFVKVVPTIYEFANGEQIVSNQYSVTQHTRPKNAHHPNVVPGIFFIYDLSPIMVHIKEQNRSFTHFLVSICAIVGGVFTVSGLLDAMLFNLSTGLANRKKAQGPAF